MNIGQFLKASPLSSMILLADIIGLVICFNLAHYLRVNQMVDSQLTLGFLIAVTLICLYAFNSYNIETPNKALRVVSRTILACLIALLLAILTGFLIGREAFIPIFGRTILFTAFILFILWACFFRYIGTRFSKVKSQNHWLFMGDEIMANQFRDDFAKHKHSGKLTIHICDADNNDTQYKQQLEYPWNGIVIDSLSALPQSISTDLLQQRLSGKRIFSLTEFYSKQWTKVPIFHIGQQWLMDVDGFSLLEDSVNFKLKRIFDFLLSTILGVFCLPLILVIAILVRVDSSGGAFYKQSRVGLRGKTFNLYKFRTMYADAEKQGPQWTSRDDPRITRVGHFLRRTRLDELPQIYNVLLGQMSFIGPRPERPEFVIELEQQIPYYDLRHLIKPGITGWAQVMFEYGASVEDAKEKLQYDLFYIKNQSILLDSIILLKTLRIVISAVGR